MITHIWWETGVIVIAGVIRLVITRSEREPDFPPFITRLIPSYVPHFKTFLKWCFKKTNKKNQKNSAILAFSRRRKYWKRQ